MQSLSLGYSPCPNDTFIFYGLVHGKVPCPEVKFILHYALLGDYDFMDIYEAPDEEIAAKVSMISRENGAFQAQSWTAIPYKRFLDLIKEI